jgi:hypothetical protein
MSPLLSAACALHDEHASLLAAAAGSAAAHNAAAASDSAVDHEAHALDHKQQLFLLGRLPVKAHQVAATEQRSATAKATPHIGLPKCLLLLPPLLLLLRLLLRRRRRLLLLLLLLRRRRRRALMKHTWRSLTAGLHHSEKQGQSHAAPATLQGCPLGQTAPTETATNVAAHNYKPLHIHLPLFR